MDVPFLIRCVGVLLFGYGAVCDWRYRRAPNLVWGLIAALGVSAVALEAARDPNRLAIVAGIGLCLSVTSALAIIAFSQGWIAGADAKAVMVLPIIFPHLPDEALQEYVFGVLTQGIEVVIWVWVGTAIAGLWFARPTVEEKYKDGIPFLVPLLAGILGLFLIP